MSGTARRVPSTADLGLAAGAERGVVLGGPFDGSAIAPQGAELRLCIWWLAGQAAAVARHIRRERRRRHERADHRWRLLARRRS